MRQKAPIIEGGVALVGRLWPRSLWRRSLFVALLITLGLLTLAAACPILFLGMFLGSELIGGLFGPVNFWNTALSMPSAQKMSGIYSLTQPSVKFIGQLSHVKVRPSHLTLRPDHTALFENLYEYEEFTEASPASPLCMFHGAAKWAVLSSNQLELELKLAPSAQIEGPDICHKQTRLTFQLLGHTRPEALWSYIGDPDEDTGLRYERNN